MPAAKNEGTEPRIKIVLFGPQVGQYEKCPCVVFAADKVEDAVSDAAQFLDDDDVIDKLRAVFNLERAITVQASDVISKQFNATEEPTNVTETKIKQSVASADQSEKTGYGQACKNCGQSKTRGPLSGKYGTWYGCQTQGCRLGPKG